MREFFIFFVLFLGFGLSSGDCPKYITCKTSEEQKSCPEGKFYRENIKVHGCCPGCVSLKGLDQACEIHADCQPGLTCTDKKCVKDPSQGCEFYKRFDEVLQKTKYWNPQCLPDGTYAPKQCKGEKIEGKCFCVNKKGERIFGEEEWAKAENMTCGCSRLVEELNVGLHCDHLGNFEPLQCNYRVCWCANPTSGIPYTDMVPLEMISSLPCFNRDSMGAQYYRQCDSGQQALEATLSLLGNHGTTGIFIPSANCNFDGSFHRVQTIRDKKRCVYINNLPLTEAMDSSNSNCNCAYDKYVAQLSQTAFFAECEYNGNYKKRQICDGKEYCVDEDGFHYSSDASDCSSPY